MLRLMKIDELVARDEDDYVRIATMLIDDVDFRRSLAARIRGAQALIFDDPTPTAALAEFLRR